MSQGSSRATHGTGGTSEEHALISNPARDTAVAVGLSLATAITCILVAIPSSREALQRIDDTFLRHLLAIRSAPLTGLARVFNVLGGIFVTLPVRLAVIAFLAWRRRWWHAAAFASAMIISEILIGQLKPLFGRARPPASLALVPTTGHSFPSGHAVATSVTVVAMVIALFPGGPHRVGWGAAAALFAFFMALSRVYLAAHWLSDVVAGTLLGTSVAVDSALVVQRIWDRRVARGAAGPAPEPEAEPPGGLELSPHPAEDGPPAR